MAGKEQFRLLEGKDFYPMQVARIFHPQFSSREHFDMPVEDALELRDAMSHYRSGKGFRNDIQQDTAPAFMQTITCRTLIIHSELDRSVPLDHALHTALHIPNARLEVLENPWGHLIWVGEGSGQTHRAVRDFCRNQ